MKKIILGIFLILSSICFAEIQKGSKVLYYETTWSAGTLANKLQEISTQEQPIVPLYNDESIVAYNKHLKNYEALVYGVDLAKIEWVD